MTIPRAVAGFALVALLALAGCGSPASPSSSPGAGATGVGSSESEDTGTSDSGSISSSESAPRCDDVWQTGQHLPADYAGTCTTAGSTESDSGYTCADGSHVWLYQERSQRLYALPGEPIKTLSDRDWLDYLTGTCKPR